VPAPACGVDEVGDPLRLGQIQPAVQERALGELAGLGQPQPGRAGQRVEAGR
jgi:hypothetical protein